MATADHVARPRRIDHALPPDVASTCFSAVLRPPPPTFPADADADANCSFANFPLSFFDMAPVSSSLAAIDGGNKASIELENSDLWNQFHRHTTEMIVTKVGRRMFPTLRLQVSNLDPASTYAMYVIMRPVDGFRYKFHGGEWIVQGQVDAMNTLANTPVVYQHPDSPAPGRTWMQQPVSFHRIKLTNNSKSARENVILGSMRKYQPYIYVVKLHDHLSEYPVQVVAELSPPETQFIAVTAYQNECVTKLKVNYNPFAKGFRQWPSSSQQSSEEERAVKSANVDGGRNLAGKPPSKRRRRSTEDRPATTAAGGVAKKARLSHKSLPDERASLTSAVAANADADANANAADTGVAAIVSPSISGWPAAMPSSIDVSPPPPVSMAAAVAAQQTYFASEFAMAAAAAAANTAAYYRHLAAVCSAPSPMPPMTHPLLAAAAAGYPSFVNVNFPLLTGQVSAPNMLWQQPSPPESAFYNNNNNGLRFSMY